MLEIGKSFTMTHTVEPHQTAAAMKSGALNVLATPILVAFLEECCLECVKPYLEEGMTTVGTAVNITHEAPTPVGGKVTAQCFLRAVDGRKLSFSVEASDGSGIIARGTHERFIVDSLKFQKKCDQKKENGGSDHV